MHSSTYFFISLVFDSNEGVYYRFWYNSQFLYLKDLLNLLTETYACKGKNYIELHIKITEDLFT